MVGRCCSSMAGARSKGTRTNTLARHAVSLVPTIQIHHQCGEKASLTIRREMTLTRTSISMSHFSVFFVLSFLRCCGNRSVCKQNESA